MYFQKLEQLSKKEQYKKLYLIIDTLDTWLTLLPKSYADRIIPETFAKLENLPLKVVYMLFDELVKMKLFKLKYVLKCPNLECKHILYLTTDLNELREHILMINENGDECNFCDGFNKINTDNIYTLYELIDAPQKAHIPKKKDVDKFLNCDNNETRNLTTLIQENPKEYKTQLAGGLMEIVPNEVQKKIQYLLEQ